MRALASAGLITIHLCCCFLQTNGVKANGDHHTGKAAAAAPGVEPAKAGGGRVLRRRTVAVDAN